MKRKELAKKYFLEGYNCIQSVVLPFKDVISIEEKELLRTISPFGGGISRLRETCGVVSAIAIIIGNIYGYDDPSDYESKKKVYEITQMLIKKFEDKYQSLSCRDLLGLKYKHDSPIPSVRNNDFFKSRPCLQYIEYSAEIIEEFLLERKLITE